MVEGSGCRVKDTSNVEHLDFVAGIGAAGLGFGHPKVVEAINEQAKSLSSSSIYYSTPFLELAEKLAQIVPKPLKKSFFVNSGAEAVEGSIKLAKKHSVLHQKVGAGIVSLTHSFHGRLGLSSALTGQSKYKKNGLSGFSAFPGIAQTPAPYCYRCPFKLQYPDCDVVCADYLEEVIRASMPGEFGALIYEPIMGVGGVIVPRDEFHKKISDTVRRHGGLLIADEVFTGMGRTGKMFACQHWGVEPDIMSIGKNLGGIGIPIAAFTARDEVAESFDPDDHFSTFGGNPISCAAAIASIDVLLKEKLPENAARMGELIMKGLKDFGEENGMIGEVRGKGLLIGIEIVKDRKSITPAPDEAKKIVTEAMNRGLLITTTGAFGCVVRLSPPLVITEAEVSKFLEIFEESVKAAAR